jgi:serine/threonine protein kinase
MISKHLHLLLCCCCCCGQVYTREYVSPEVAQAVVGGAAAIVAQPSWDLWGIGIIMWEMATGGRPD